MTERKYKVNVGAEIHAFLVSQATTRKMGVDQFTAVVLHEGFCALGLVTDTRPTPTLTPTLTPTESAPTPAPEATVSSEFRGKSKKRMDLSKY